MTPAAGTPEWHALRATGIGGSDVAPLLGLSRWSSPGKLWRLKTGREQPDPGNEFTERGTALEPAVLARYEAETLRLVGPGPSFLRHPRWDEGVRLLANVDALHLDDGSIVEAKTTGWDTGTARDFYAGVCPEYYLSQVAHYAACLQHDRATIVCMIGAGEPEACDLAIVQLAFPAALLVLIEDVCAQWWAQHVETDTPPPRGRHPRAAEFQTLARSCRAQETP